MLLLYGNETVPSSWHVDEDTPTMYTRIYLVHSGHVEYSDFESTKVLKPCHLYCFPTDRAYHMHHNASSPLNCFFLHLNINPYSVEGLFELDCSRHPFICDLIGTMKGVIKEAQAGELLEPLSSALSVYLMQQGVIKDFPKPITAALKYIGENIRKNPTVEEISRHCGYNSRYFIRMFTKHLGTSPHQYILSYKMQIALRLLNSGQSATKTAEDLGFTELKSFGRCFKRQYGFPPTAFKKHFILMP